MIRQQQLQLQQLQAAQGHSHTSVAAEDATPTSERSSSAILPTPITQPIFPALSSSVPRSPVLSHPRSSFDIARDALHRRSRTPSRGAPSPRMRSTSISGENGEPHLSGVRDEIAYYQAETQSLSRENQMLHHRIRELGERYYRNLQYKRTYGLLLCRTTTGRGSCKCFANTGTGASFASYTVYIGVRGRGSNRVVFHYSSVCWHCSAYCECGDCQGRIKGFRF